MISSMFPDDSPPLPSPSTSPSFPRWNSDGDTGGFPVGEIDNPHLAVGDAFKQYLHIGVFTDVPNAELVVFTVEMMGKLSSPDVLELESVKIVIYSFFHDYSFLFFFG
jgi:hypothetical protein